MLNFDYLLDENIRMGKYQLTCFIISALLCTSIGISTTQLSLFLTLYKGEYDLNFRDVIALATIYRLGNLLAGFFILNCTNRIGKILSIEISLIFNILASLLAFYQYSFDLTCLIFVAQGFQQGVVQQIGHLITVEVIVKSVRGKISTILTIFQGIGAVMPIGLCLYYCESFTKGNIPALYFYILIYNVVMLLTIRIFGRENPRFYLSRGRFSESFLEMNNMLMTNQSEMLQLNKHQKDEIIQWFNENFRNQTEHQSLGQIFRRRIFQVTIYSCMFYVTYYSLNSIQQYIVPFVLGNANKGFHAYLYQQLLMIPAVILQGLVVDNEYFGRARSGFFTSVILAIAYFAIYYFDGHSLVFLLSVIRFFLTILLTVTQIIISEAYNSTLRVIGLSFAYSVAKLTQLISPWLIFRMYELNPYYPFIFAGLILIVNSVLFTTCPRDRTKKQLEEAVSETMSMYSQEQIEDDFKHK